MDLAHHEPLISVVIATYNNVEYLRACLINLSALQFPRRSFEVVVVNDGSTDWTRSFLDSYRPEYQLQVVHQENGGRATARNKGAAHAQGKLLVMLDADCLTSPDTLDRLWAAHLEEEKTLLLSRVEHIAAQHVPIVLMQVASGSQQYLQEAEDLRPADSSYALQALLPAIKEHLGELSVGWLAAQGAAISIPKTAFSALGGFDERFKTYGMEDFDLGFCHAIRGEKLRYVPEAKLYHMDHGHDQLGLLAETAISIRTFYSKHADRPEAHPFLDFLIGKITFLDFNNQVARALSQPEIWIEELDRRCSGYDMARYRSEQAIDVATAPVSYAYNASQTFCLDLLIKKVAKDIDADHGTGIELLKQPLPGSHILVVAPHMDDEVIGCGGLIQRYKEQGALVTVIFCSSGSGQPRKLGTAETLVISDERIAESRKACEVLGVDRVEFFHLRDRQLGLSLQEDRRLREMLRAGLFDALYSPGPDEFHPDHKAVWRWVREAVHEVAPNIPMYCYEVWGSCRPNCVLPLDEAAWNKKISALQAYRSQLRVMDYVKLTTEISKRRGALVREATGMEHAEAFRAVGREA